jgi:hypothetical protein
MQRSPLLLLVLLLTVSLPAGVVGAGGASPAVGGATDSTAVSGAATDSTAASGAAPASASTAAAATTGRTQASFDRNRVVLRVFENGSARWTFHYRRTLENSTERRNFQSFAEEFNANRTRLYRRFKTDSKGLVREGENVTGREMNATGFSREAYVTNTTFGRPIGVVEMRFVWTGFAVERGDRVIVGDVFDGGLYLGPQQTLVVSPGPNLTFRSVDPEGTLSNATSLRLSDSVTWQGEREFTDNRPRVVFVQADDGNGTTDGTPTVPANGTTVAGENSGDDEGGDGASSGPGSSSESRLPIVLISLGALLVAAAVAALWYREEGDDGGEGPPPAGDGPDPDPHSGAGAGTGGPATGGTTAAGDGPATVGGDGADPGEPTVTDDELLSDEDRVVALIREQGGRMKQVNIVDRTGWSKSKVSMLLSEMEEEGQISKLRVGRENVISLKGHEPDATDSPFGNEE